MSNPSPWIKASKSSNDNMCAELRRNGDIIELRDSKDPDGPVLSFTPKEIDALFDGVRRMEFDHLIDLG